MKQRHIFVSLFNLRYIKLAIINPFSDGLFDGH